MAAPTLTDEIAEIQREIKMRRGAYKRWIAEGRLKQADADWRIACLEATLKRPQEMAPPPPQGAFL